MNEEEKSTQKPFLINYSHPPIDWDETIILATDNNEDIYAYNPKDSELLYTTKRESDKYKFDDRYVKLLEDEIIFMGMITIEERKRNKIIGIYKRVIDKKTGKEKNITYSKFNEMDKVSNFEIDEFGSVKGKGNIVFQSFDITPSGEVVALAETYKERSRVDKYTDLAFLRFDKDLKVKSLEFYNVGVSNGSKYEYNQDLPNNEGKAFFFINKDNDKNWVLNILAYNYGKDKVNSDEISLQDKKSEISFQRAKKGYITIVEWFKNAKPGEKEIEFRLEKLNY